MKQKQRQHLYRNPPNPSKSHLKDRQKTPSKITSLKAILNQGRLSLNQYINEKPNQNSNNNNGNSSYFDKMKAKFGNGGIFKKNIKAVGSEMINEEDENGKDFYTIKERRISTRSALEDKSLRPSFRNREKLQQRANQNQTAQKQKLQQSLIKQNRVQTEIKSPTEPLRYQKPYKIQTINYKKFQPLSNTLSQQFQHQFNEFELTKLLGSGAYASVRVGRDCRTDKKYAVKIYEKYRLIQNRKKMRVRREIQILSKLDHENIIKTYNCYQNNRQIHFIFQHIQNGITLQQHLRTKRNTIPTNKILKQLTKAIHYLHSNNIAHRDIKTENIIVNQQNQLKLIDFGFSTNLVMSDLQCGTPNYMAPELFIKNRPNCTQKVDMWAVGVLFYYLVEGCYPFRGYNEKDLIRNINEGVFVFSNKADQFMRGIIERLLVCQPEDRMEAWELNKLMHL